MTEITSQDAALVDSAERAIGFLLAPYLGDRSATADRLSENEVRQISAGLHRMGKESWAKVPRLYVVLRMVDHVQVIDSFVTQGITDLFFPFSHKTLPESLRSASARFEFLKLQDLVLTKAFDLEREDGKHRHFSKPEDIPLIKLEELGKGGFGFVDRVLSTVTYKEYARKTIPRGRNFKKNLEVLRDFERELGNLKKMSHIHIVELVGSYTDPKFVGILMSPIADSNLKDFLAQGPLSSAQRSFLRTFFGCLANALCYLHENRIRHKDIKPQNVLVKGHQVFLTDFGISLDWSESGQSTTTGVTVKTPRYCAPEVADYLPRNSLSDVWSLGCVFLEIWNILKGETTDAIFDYLECHGSNSTCYYLNCNSALQWCSMLKDKTSSPDENPPLSWIRGMLQTDQEQRWSAQILVDRIREVNEDVNLRYAFSGTCCLNEDDSTDTDRRSNRSSMILEETGASSVEVYHPKLSTDELEKENQLNESTFLSLNGWKSKVLENSKGFPRIEGLLQEVVEGASTSKTIANQSDAPDEDTVSPGRVLAPPSKNTLEDRNLSLLRQTPISRHTSLDSSAERKTANKNINSSLVGLDLLKGTKDVQGGMVTAQRMSKSIEMPLLPMRRANESLSPSMVSVRDETSPQSDVSFLTSTLQQKHEENSLPSPTRTNLSTSARSPQKNDFNARVLTDNQPATLSQHDYHKNHLREPRENNEIHGSSQESDLSNFPLSNSSSEPYLRYRVTRNSRQSQQLVVEKNKSHDMIEDGRDRSLLLELPGWPLKTYSDYQETQTENFEAPSWEMRAGDENLPELASESLKSDSDALIAYLDQVDRRKEIITEILVLHDSFTKDMRVLTEVYQSTADVVMSETERWNLFGNQTRRMNFAVDFQQRLCSSSLISFDGKSNTHDFSQLKSDADIMIGDAFLSFRPAMQRLINGHKLGKSIGTLNTIYARPAAQEWLNGCNAKSRDLTYGKGIEGLLRAPLTQFNIYLSQLSALKVATSEVHADYSNLKIACNLMEDLAKACQRDLQAGITLWEYATKGELNSQTSIVVSDEHATNEDPVMRTRHSSISKEENRSYRQFIKRFAAHDIQSVYTRHPKLEVQKKVVFVGDSCIGASSVLRRASENKFYEMTKQTIMDNYCLDVRLGSLIVELDSWDTAGGEDYDRLRPLAYPDTDVMVIGFAIDNPDSLDNIKEKWTAEVIHFCADIPRILVGYRSDLRHKSSTIQELRKRNQNPVTYEEAMKISEDIACLVYIECSARTGNGIEDLFEVITSCAIARELDKKPDKKSKRRWFSKTKETSQQSAVDFSILGYDPTTIVLDSE